MDFFSASRFFKDGSDYNKQLRRQLETGWSRLVEASNRLLVFCRLAFSEHTSDTHLYYPLSTATIHLYLFTRSLSIMESRHLLIYY